MERYFPEPYRFIPPVRSTFWVRMARGMIARHLRRKQGVSRLHVEGLENFHRSREQHAGIVLAANHNRAADPSVLGVICSRFNQYLYYVASYHLFRQSRFMGWFLNRIGGYSIWREGADRESIKATTRILADAERPVVLFPEGTWFRQNDRVGPLQDGLSLMTRSATRQSSRPILVHPVGIKYWLLQDPTPALHSRLALLEQRLGWHPQKGLPLIPRIEKLGGALVALKEVEYLGEAQVGDLDIRIRRLAEVKVERLELKHLGKAFDGWLLERVRRVRQHLTRRLLECANDREAAASIKEDLAHLLLCENLASQSLEYLRENPTPERLAETIQRIEETLSDADEVPLVPMGVSVRFGEPIDVRAVSGERRGGGDPLVPALRAAMQRQVDLLNEKGPPADWGCPSRKPAARPGSACQPPADETRPEMPALADSPAAH